LAWPTVVLAVNVLARVVDRRMDRA
jgi:hypothetical protein